MEPTEPVVDVPGGCQVSVRVIPRAARSAFAGRRGAALLVRLAAPPVDGAANAALLDLFVDTFHVPKRAVRLVSGERARDKRIAIDGVSAAQASATLAPFLGESTS